MIEKPRFFISVDVVVLWKLVEVEGRFPFHFPVPPQDRGSVMARWGQSSCISTESSPAERGSGIIWEMPEEFRDERKL